MLYYVFVGLVCFYGVLKFSDVMIAGTQVFGLRNERYQNLVGYILGGLTSLPELVVTIASIATGNPEIAIVNIIASNVINTIFLAIQSWRFEKLHHFKNKHFADELFIAFLAIVLPSILFFSGVDHAVNAAVGIGLFTAFVIWEKIGSRKFTAPLEEPPESGWLFEKIRTFGTINRNIFLVVLFGVTGLTVSGYLMSEYLDIIMRELKGPYPWLAIAVGIFAGVATSAPEFKSFGATYELYKSVGEKFTYADTQSCLDNCNASSCFNYGIVYPIGVYGGIIFASFIG